MYNMDMESTPKKLLSIKEAAAMLGVSPLTLRNWDNNGKLEASRHPLNNYRVYSREVIEKLLVEIGTNKERRPRPNKNTPRKLMIKHLDT